MRRAIPEGIGRRSIPVLSCLLFTGLTISLIRSDPSSQSVLPSAELKWILISISSVLAVLFLDRVIGDAAIKILLRGPTNRFSCLSGDEWGRQDIVRDGHSIPIFLRLVDGQAPLMVFNHGWTSSSERMKERAELVHDQGCHVLLVDQRNHGCAEDDDEWTAPKQIADLAHVLNSIETWLPKERVSSVSTWGHSLGGFLSLGFAKQQQGWWEDCWGIMILESSMTSYGLIMKRDFTALKQLLLPWFKRHLKRAWRSLHPELFVDGVPIVGIPEWGHSPCPTIVFHPEEDVRLGNDHHDLLLSHLPDWGVEHEVHVMSGFHHTGMQIHQERDTLVAEFIKRHLH